MFGAPQIDRSIWGSSSCADAPQPNAPAFLRLAMLLALRILLPTVVAASGKVRDRTPPLTTDGCPLKPPSASQRLECFPKALCTVHLQWQPASRRHAR
jgi:hypothetical protein